MSCVEGYEKTNELSGSYMCEDSGKWSELGTICVPKDCGAPRQVLKRRAITFIGMVNEFSSSVIF